MLVLALLTSINPVRLGIILVVLSRLRPLRNLVAYWTGAAIIGLTTLIVPLIALHAAPTSATFLRDFANPTANPVAQRTAITIGVALLVIAVLMLARSLRRSPVPPGKPAVADPASPGSVSTLLLDSSAPPAISRLLQTAAAAAAEEGESPIRRLFGRIRVAWQEGSPWISFVIGVIVLPPLDGVVFALAIIVASGAALGVQVGAAIAFVIGVLAVEEIILISNVAAPARTQAALQRLHDWARTHHRKFAAAILAVVGISLVARGMGGL
ncbi:GAP family protein [Mycolicibacterium alvei]|nr:GAP family protein [Mycolicibacterium alvei]